MKKFFLPIFFLLATIVFSQVGIGTITPATSAILDTDVSSLVNKKGFLFPRVELTGNNDISTIINPALGLMVYNKKAANFGVDHIPANIIALWDGFLWQTISSLTEIKSLKVPIDFVALSKTEQIFSSTDLTILNGNQPIVVKLFASDIYIPNVNDISLDTTTSVITFNTTSYYDLSGMLSFRVNVASAGLTSQVIATIQSSTDGINWTGIASVSLPLESYAASQTQTITFPNFIHHFNSRDQLRIVIYKSNYSSANNYQTDSGIQAVAKGTDFTKYLRIVRLQQ